MLSRALLGLSLLFSAPAAWAAPDDRTEAPYFVVQGGEDVRMPLEESRADIRVVGPIARVQVTQVYHNLGATAVEAVYVFPASTRAAVHGMRMKIGQRTIEAKIQKRDEARNQYEAAKSNGQTASLLEQERPNVFTMNVANILPGDLVEVELDYSELLVPTEGTYELVYPAVVGPRYSGGAEAWANNPHVEGPKAPFRFGVKARVESGLPLAAVSSPSHSVTPHFLSQQAAELELKDPDSGNRDFVLRYRLAGGAIETGLMLLPGQSEGYFLLQVEPPARITPEVVVAREYVFIVDVSGSMGGFPLETAKTLLRSLLAKLRPIDRFNVLLFAGGNRVLAERSLPATPANLARALETIDREHGGGGTELLPAMKRALALPRSEEVSSTALVVITDGYVTVEQEALKLVQENLGRASLFAFGIGSSVNRHLIESLARAGLGEPFVVLDQASAPQTAERFLKYIDAPVLTQVTVEAEGFNARDLEPKHLPDLYASRPLVLLGKYKGAPTGRLIVRGQTANGPFEQAIRVSDAVPSDDHAVIRTLWARQRVERLSDLEGVGGPAKVAEQITKLGLAHSIMTQHTSFVAIDSAVRNRNGSTTVRQALPMPAGVPNGTTAGKAGAIGYLRGNAIGDSAGMGGLGRRGTGAGGGGSGAGSIGLGTYGTSGGGYAAGPPQGVGTIGKKKGDRDIIISAGSPVVMGSLSKDLISKVIKKNRNRLRYCYERELLRNPTLQGKVAIEFVIDGSGAVTKAEVSQTTVANPALEQCLQKVVLTLRFPQPTGGGIIVVKYPFVFRPNP